MLPSENASATPSLHETACKTWPAKIISSFSVPNGEILFAIDFPSCVLERNAKIVPSFKVISGIEIFCASVSICHLFTPFNP